MAGPHDPDPRTHRPADPHDPVPEPTTRTVARSRSRTHRGRSPRSRSRNPPLGRSPRSRLPDPLVGRPHDPGTHRSGVAPVPEGRPVRADPTLPVAAIPERRAVRPLAGPGPVRPVAVPVPARPVTAIAGATAVPVTLSRAAAVARPAGPEPARSLAGPAPTVPARAVPVAGSASAGVPAPIARAIGVAPLPEAALRAAASPDDWPPGPRTGIRRPGRRPGTQVPTPVTTVPFGRSCRGYPPLARPLSRSRWGRSGRPSRSGLSRPPFVESVLTPQSFPTTIRGVRATPRPGPRHRSVINSGAHLDPRE